MYVEDMAVVGRVEVCYDSCYPDKNKRVTKKQLYILNNYILNNNHKLISKIN